MWEKKSNALFQIVPYLRDEEIKLRQTRCIDENTVLRHAEYLTATLLKDVTLV